MSGPKRKATKQDWIFRIFVVACIIISYCVILKTKPEGRPFGIGSSASISSEVSAVADVEIKHPDINSSVEETVTKPDDIIVKTPDEEPGNSSDGENVDNPGKEPVETPTETPVETPVETPAETPVETPVETPAKEPVAVAYHFRNNSLLTSHYEKHGIEMGFDSKESYEAAASAVITNPAALHKIEAEDGDDIYYIESTNEFVVLSTDGYIRTYFKPDSGKRYYDKQ